MTKAKEYSSGLYIVAIVLLVLSVAILIHDIAEAPEVVVEYQDVIVEVPAECEEVVCDVCVECEVCSEVVDEDLLEEQSVKQDIEGLVVSLIEDEDFIEDDLVDFLEAEYNVSVSDEDDVIKVELEELDVDWDVDEEEGSYEARVEVHFYADDSREDYISRDVLLVGEFDEDDLEDMLDEEELNDFELIDA